jgi:hypothetical protein
MQCFVEIDLVQAEWVATAYIANDPRMIDVVSKKVDPHLRTGSLISGAPESFVKHENTLVGHLTDPGDIALARRALPPEWDGIKVADFFLPRNMSVRQAGKKSNHGLNYGEQYKTFALTNEMDEGDAKHIVELYRKVAYPGLSIWYKLVELELRKNGRRLTNCFGQSRRFLERWGPDLLNAAYAFKPQSTIANVTNFGWRDTYYDRHESMRRVAIAAQVHDSVKTHNEYNSYDNLHTQVSRCVYHMTTICEYNGHQFIIDPEVKVGYNWGHMITVHDVTPDGLEKALEGIRADALPS